MDELATKRGCVPVFELLEPRLLLSVSLSASDPQDPSTGGLGGQIIVDLEGRANPVHAGLETAGEVDILARAPAASNAPSAPITLDPGLEQAIRDALSKPTGELTADDLASLTALDASYRGIVDLEGIQGCVNMESLVLSGNSIVSVGPLSVLTSLWYLDLYGNQIVDVAPLGPLTDILYLYLDGNEIGDLQPLVDSAGLDTGDVIDVSGNPLILQALTVQIPALEARGVTVYHDQVIPSVSEVLIERGINHGVAGLDSASYSYYIDILGEGLWGAQVTTPWSESVHTLDLLDDWDGQNWYEVAQGPLWAAIGREEGGEVAIELEWEWLSDAQWASLDTGQTSISIIGAGAVIWNHVLNFSTVTQPIETPLLTSPAHRVVEDATLTVQWASWLAPTPNPMVEVYVEAEWDIPHWWTGDEYEDEASLPASATEWTFIDVPDSTGIYWMEVMFLDVHQQTLDWADVLTIAGSASDCDVVVGSPDLTIRTGVGAQAGREYFQTPAGTWQDSQAYAQAYGGNLVTIEDAAQEDWLRNEYGDGLFWIGLNDFGIEDDWQWADGSSSIYMNWAADQPDNEYGGHGAVMNYQVDWPHSGGTQWANMGDWEWFPGIAWMPSGEPAPYLADDYGNTAAAGTWVSVDTPFEGVLNYRSDIDFFSFTTAAGQTYDITLSTDGLPYGLGDSTMWLYDSDGTTLLTWDDEGGQNSDSRIVWTAPAAGTFHLAVDFYSAEDQPGWYNVVIAASPLTSDPPDASFPFHRADTYILDTTRGVVESEPFYTGPNSRNDEILLQVLDLTDPLNPATLGGYFAGDIDPPSLDASAGILYYLDRNNAEFWGAYFTELVALDITGPGDPGVLFRTKLNSTGRSLTAGVVEDGYLYAVSQDPSDYSEYFEVHEFTDPAQPPTLTGATGQLTAFGGYPFYADRILIDDFRVYLFDEYGAATVISVDDPTNPSVQGQFDLGGQSEAIDVLDDMLLVGDNDEMRVIDTGDASSPVEMAPLVMSGAVERIIIAGNRTYVGCIGVGVQVVDSSDPAAPQIIGDFAVNGATGELAISGGHLYVPTGAGETAVFVLNVPGDFTGDGGVDAADIDDLAAAIRNSSPEAKYDLNGDGDLDGEDMDELVHNILGSEYGDADLNGAVDNEDFEDLVGNFGLRAGWPDGDFSGDGSIDLHDFAIIRGKFGWVAAAAEPAPTAPPETPVSASVTDQPLAVAPDSEVAEPAALAADVNLSAALPSPLVHVAGSQPLTMGLITTTLYRAVTAACDDLRALSGDLSTGSAAETDLASLHNPVASDDPLADILAESPLDAVIFLDELAAADYN